MRATHLVISLGAVALVAATAATGCGDDETTSTTSSTTNPSSSNGSTSGTNGSGGGATSSTGAGGSGAQGGGGAGQGGNGQGGNGAGGGGSQAAQQFCGAYDQGNPKCDYGMAGNFASESACIAAFDSVTPACQACWVQHRANVASDNDSHCGHACGITGAPQGCDACGNFCMP